LLINGYKFSAQQLHSLLSKIFRTVSTFVWGKFSLKLLSEKQIASQEVINLMPGNPDRVLWLGIKLLNKSMSAIIWNVLDCGTGGKNFQRGKACYQALKNQFGDYK